MNSLWRQDFSLGSGNAACKAGDKIYKIFNLLYIDSIGFSLSGYIKTNDLINFYKSVIFKWYTATSTVENTL